MIDRSLHLLTLHVIWKARNFMNGAIPPADEERFVESLREQRDILLEKLLEFAVGTQSNALQATKRAVRVLVSSLLACLILKVKQAFQNLMNLHVLFSSSEAVHPDGQEFPLARLSLSMDDEVQYRCAGFVQAEIERYAEELEPDRPAKAAESDDGFSSQSEDDDNPDTGQGKRGKHDGKKSGEDEGICLLLFSDVGD
jgi:cohesin complex subunit SA-1/2